MNSRPGVVVKESKISSQQQQQQKATKMKFFCLRHIDCYVLKVVHFASSSLLNVIFYLLVWLYFFEIGVILFAHLASESQSSYLSLQRAGHAPHKLFSKAGNWPSFLPITLLTFY